jgi:putative endonuclease
MRRMFYVYILESLKDAKTYVGYTKNVEQRLYLHNKGQVRSTKHRRPLKVLFTEKFDDEAEAKKREIWWKSGAGRRNLKDFFDKK